MSRAVWVTRASPGAEATGRRLADLSYEPLVAPLLFVEPIAGAAIDLAGIAALAFTSINGVDAFAARSDERALPVFAVGETTAAAARRHGFADVTSADGDVAALAAAIAARGPLSGELLHAGALEPAGDLAADLAARGVPARSLAVYHTVARDPAPETLARLPDLAAVLLHSPKAARALGALLALHPVPALAAVCLSPNVAAPLAGAPVACVAVADAPTEAALLSRLAEVRPLK